MSQRKHQGGGAKHKMTRTRWFLAVVLGAILLVSLIWTLLPESGRAIDPATQEAEEHQSDTDDQKEGHSRKVRGRWLRPDGNYVLEISSISRTGRLKAAYHNPRPIHVSAAEVSEEGQVVNVYVELADVGYPGSYYRLTYDPESDQLRGVYFQAVQRTTFDVFFVRIP